MATAGATQGLHLVATVMFDKTTPVFVEDPTYFIAIKILREDFGMNIIPGRFLLSLYY
jgi:DNA-binding transcriptional MocR family regulator